MIFHLTVQLVFFRLHLMFYAQATNIRCDGYCSTFWDFGLKLNMGIEDKEEIQGDGGAY